MITREWEIYTHSERDEDIIAQTYDPPFTLWLALWSAGALLFVFIFNHVSNIGFAFGLPLILYLLSRRRWKQAGAVAVWVIALGLYIIIGLYVWEEYSFGFIHWVGHRNAAGIFMFSTFFGGIYFISYWPFIRYLDLDGQGDLISEDFEDAYGYCCTIKSVFKKSAIYRYRRALSKVKERHAQDTKLQQNKDD